MILINISFVVPVLLFVVSWTVKESPVEVAIIKSRFVRGPDSVTRTSSKILIAFSKIYLNHRQRIDSVFTIVNLQ